MDPQPVIERQPAIVHLPQSVRIDAQQLWDICRANPDWQFELSAGGDLIIMPPSGGRTGARNLRIATALGTWADADGTGVAFDSSTGFILPNGAIRSPDAAWVSHQRLESVPELERDRFLRLSPDFVIELRSPTDPLPPLQQKMEEYCGNGVRLGWLIDPSKQTIFVYRPDASRQVISNAEQIAAGEVAPGFALDLRRLWRPGL